MVAAAFRGYTEIITALADAGAYVDIIRERDSATPLLAATYEGHAKVVERLLELGADPALPDEDGCSPLMAAGSGSNGGSAIEALHVAASNGDTATATALLDAGADPAVRDHRGRTPADVADDRVADLLRLLTAD